MTKTILIGTLPDIVLPEERAALMGELKAEHNKRWQLYASLSSEAVRQRHKEAQTAYRAAPTVSHLEALRAAWRERQAVSATSATGIRESAKLACVDFVESAIKPPE